MHLDDLYRDDTEAVEYLLKREMLDCLITIQYNRAKGDPPYKPAVEKYISFARMLRVVMAHQQAETGSRYRRYKNLHEMDVWAHNHHKFDDDEWKGSRNFLDVLRSLHETGAKPTVA